MTSPRRGSILPACREPPHCRAVGPRRDQPVVRHLDVDPEEPRPELHRLGTLAQVMLHTSLDAFVQLDVPLARSLSAQDDAVDELEDYVKSLLYARIREDTRTLEAAAFLLDVTHVLERTADRSTNIAERVIYIATASREDLNP